MRIFVAWDFSGPANLTLQALQRRPPAGVEIDVPGLAAHGGEILRDRVLPGIVKADRVLVIADTPNANVGFEAGLALGLGRQVAFMVQRQPRPKWLEQPPFSRDGGDRERRGPVTQRA